MNEHETPQTPPAPTSTGLRRWLWLSAGVLLVALGGIGVVVPGMPTTVFFIGAAACFARSSPRFEQWVLDLPRIGPLVRDYRSGLGMTRRAKIFAVTSIVTAILISSIFIPAWTGRIAVYALALLGVWYILRLVPTRERVLADREHHEVGRLK